MALDFMSPSTPVPQLHESLAFETLISDTSASLIATPFEELDRAIESALERIRLFLRADRCGLLDVSEDQQFVNVTHASYADGISRVSGSLNLVELFPWCRQKLVVDREPVIVSRMADLPPEAAVDRASWDALQTRSNLSVPIVVGPALRHLIVVQTVLDEREWSAGYVSRMRLLGEVLVNALERQRAFDALRLSEARLERAVDAAQLGFSEWSPGSGHLFVDPRMRDLLGLNPEDEDIQTIWLSRVHQDDRASVVGERARLLAGEISRMAIEYRYEHPRRGWIWLRHTSRRLEGPRRGGPHLVGALADITENRAREEKLHAALDELGRLRQHYERENVYLREESRDRFGSERIIGRSSAIRHALALAEEVASTNSTVLLIGETGTGKERFASLIHEASPRHARTMIRVNCPAIPDALIESELFGREKGAYTGALSKQIGRFELANGSTLFLDEISDLPLEMQVKLLRVLQERTIERLGSPRSLPVDVRIIAATNRDLEQAVREHTFRSDLYYRINVFPIVIPPLRERPEDIALLVEAFVDEIAPGLGKRFESVDRSSLDALQRYEWPGNVRELRNVIERAAIRSPGRILHIELPQSAPVPAAAAGEAAPADLKEVEREHIIRVLRDAGWRVRGAAGAAEVLGLKPTTLEARMIKLGIRRPVTHSKQQASPPAGDSARQ